MYIPRTLSQEPFDLPTPKPRHRTKYGADLMKLKLKSKINVNFPNMAAARSTERTQVSQSILNIEYDVIYFVMLGMQSARTRNWMVKYA